MAEERPHLFRWVPALQLSAQIKTIEMLWHRFPDADAVLKKCVDQLRRAPESTPIWRVIAIGGPAMVRHLESSIDELPLPQPVRLQMKGFIIPITHHALHWYRISHDDLGERPTQRKDIAEEIRYLLSMRWKNSGFVDFRGSLQKYASTKHTADFNLWNTLCRYSVEDQIIRLGPKVDWSKAAEFTQYYQIYWYHKTFGEFPSPDLCTARLYLRFMKRFGDEAYDERAWAKCILSECVHLWAWKSNLATISYTREKIQDDAVVTAMVNERLSTRFVLTDHDAEVSTFFLRTLERQVASDAIFLQKYQLWRLMLWPSIRFIEDWSPVLTRPPGIFFDECFQRKKFFYVARVNLKYEEIMADHDAAIDALYTDPLARIWSTVYRKFHAHENEMNEVWLPVFHGQDLVVCKLLMNGLSTPEKMRFIRMLGAVDHGSVEPGFYEFCGKFSEEVLETEEERRFFEESCDLRLEEHLPARDNV